MIETALIIMVSGVVGGLGIFVALAALGCFVVSAMDSDGGCEALCGVALCVILGFVATFLLGASHALCGGFLGIIVGIFPAACVLYTMYRSEKKTKKSK